MEFMIGLDEEASPYIYITPIFFVVAASLAVYTAAAASATGTRSSVHITCDNNLAVRPPPSIVDLRKGGVGVFF